MARPVLYVGIVENVFMKDRMAISVADTEELAKELAGAWVLKNATEEYKVFVDPIYRQYISLSGEQSGALEGAKSCLNTQTKQPAVGSNNSEP
ncbi:MAG TPA: hypothetical protein VK203_27550 [Nostocaceae cyanobacterium]|nr:hypothetical protein [Nostocaceae cyanobacterium]